MDVENECALLGNLFHHIVTDLKSSSPVWDDFVNKGSKLHNLLKSTTSALCVFTESIQKLADLATHTKGSTKDVGTALTRICVRQKMVENKLKHFTSLLLDNLISPVQERLEEWKKVANQLEKDHSKDYKRATQDIKKRNTDAPRQHKKSRKGSKSDRHLQLSSALHDVGERYAVLAEAEKSALRNLLVEERSRICFFANCLSPILDSQVSIMNETSHLHDLTSDLNKLCRNPKQLPTSTEQLVQDYIDAHSDRSSTDQDPHSYPEFSSIISPPPSPMSSESRKSSMCSINSLTSSDSRSSGSLNRASSLHQRHSQGYHKRTNSGSSLPNGLGSPTSCKSAPVGGTARLSISSHDSGFASAGNAAHFNNDVSGRSNMTSLIGEMNELVTEDGACGASPIIRGRSQSQQTNGASLPSLNSNRFSWKDWSKPGPYDIQISGESKNDPSPNTLPNKLPPPSVAPKPAYHRSSVDEFSQQSATQQIRSNTVDGFLAPPSSGFQPPPCQQNVESEDFLPPPPPELLEADVVSNRKRTFSGQLGPQVLPSNLPSNPGFPVMTLDRKNSVNSSQYSTSSGYNSQFTTPACSEDTIASHDTGYNSVEKYDAPTGYAYSTVPRDHHHSNRSNNLSHSSHLRHASTNGLTISEPFTADTDRNSVATIRRKPSSKFDSVRRKGSTPKAVATPTVPNLPSGPVLSTFASLPNSNNSNNNSPSALQSRDLTFGRREQNVNCDLTLRFQATNDYSGDSPTPTTTPVLGEVNSFYTSPRPTTYAKSRFE